MNEAQSLAVQRQFEALTGHFILLPIEPADFREAADWLRNWRLGLRAGDALHLAVSHRHGCVLLSLDAKLVQSAGPLGVEAELIQ